KVRGGKRHEGDVASRGGGHILPISREEAIMGLGNRRMNRRSFIRTTAAAAAGTAAFGVGSGAGAQHLSAGGTGVFAPHAKELEETSIADLQAAMEAGTYTSRQLVGMYLDRIQAIDVGGPGLNSIIEVNPDALAIATELD